MVADDCKLYVSTYAPMVFALLDTYLVGDVLCVEIGVCPPPPVFAQLAHDLGKAAEKALGVRVLGRGPA